MLSLGAATLCMPSGMRAQTPALRQSISKLYEQAEASNASIATLRAAVATAEAGVQTARADKLPDVSGQASFSYLGNARLWNRHFGESTSAPMPHYGNNFLLRAQQVLYAGGAIRSGIRLAGQQADMARWAVNDERQRVRFAVATLYLQLHCLRNQQAVYARNRELAEKQIDLMRHRREEGVALRNDITRYELQLQQMQLGETAVTDRQSIVVKQLRTALGADSAQVALLGEEAFDAGAIAMGTEGEWQQKALLQHAGLQQSQVAVDMNRTQERLARSERLPKVALVAEDHLDGPITIEVPPINKNLNYWFVGVGISYNFSSLYKSKRKITQAQLATTQAGKDATATGIQTTQQNIHTTDAGIDEARVQLENARRDDARYAQLLKDDAVTPQQYDQVHTAFLAAQARYDRIVRSVGTLSSA